MNKAEARRLLDERIHQLRQQPYRALLQWLDAPETTEVIGPSGQRYQVETQSFWDDGQKSNLRVAVSIDDYGWRAFFPLTTDFIKSPDDQFTGK